MARSICAFTQVAGPGPVLFRFRLSCPNLPRSSPSRPRNPSRERFPITRRRCRLAGQKDHGKNLLARGEQLQFSLALSVVVFVNTGVVAWWSSSRGLGAFPSGGLQNEVQNFPADSRRGRRFHTEPACADQRRDRHPL